MLLLRILKTISCISFSLNTVAHDIIVVYINAIYSLFVNMQKVTPKHRFSDVCNISFVIRRWIFVFKIFRITHSMSYFSICQKIHFPQITYHYQPKKRPPHQLYQLNLKKT